LEHHGRSKKGFSTGHATWNWANHIEHAWGNVTHLLMGGVGNTVQDTRYFHRPFMTFGYNAQFEAGMEIDAGPSAFQGRRTTLRHGVRRLWSAVCFDAVEAEGAAQLGKAPIARDI